MAVKSRSKKRPAKKRIPARPPRASASRTKPPAAWSRPRWPCSPTRSARRSPESSPSATCWRPPISTSASGAGSIPSRRAPNIWRALRPCSSMPPRIRAARSGCGEDLFDLRALARNAGDSLAGRAAAKGLQSQVEISEALPSLVVGDPVRLRAALENLIDNAVKFTEAGRRRAQGAPVRGGKAQA